MGIGASTAAVTINNSGMFNGSFSNANTTFNNLAGASWLTNYIDDEGIIAATGAGSQIEILGATNGMNVGLSGNGSLTVAAGAAVSTNFLSIGVLAGSSGAVLVTGA